jgi:hypothetical protein
MRQDGRFVGSDGSIPEGQGIIMAHLNECHELVEMVLPGVLVILSVSSCSTPYPQLKESMNEEETEEETELDEEENGEDDDGTNFLAHNIADGLKISSG